MLGAALLERRKEADIKVTLDFLRSDKIRLTYWLVHTVYTKFLPIFEIPDVQWATLFKFFGRNENFIMQSGYRD